MTPSLDALSLRTLLGVGRSLPFLAGVILLGVGVAYCFFGRRIFRLLIVGVGAAAGWELGRIVGSHFGIPPLYVAVPVACVLAGLAWPVWQVGLFVLGGGVGAVIGAEGLVSATGDHSMVIYGGAAGFLLGGLLSVLLIRAMSVGLTALTGAYLVFVGLTAMLPFAGELSSKPLLSMGAIGVLTLAGLVSQLAQGDPAEQRAARDLEAMQRAKADAEAEQKVRWEKYLE